MNIKITGKIIEAEPIQQGVSQRTGEQWVSQNYTIEELNQQYPSQCVFKVFGSDKIQQFGIRVGEILTVSLGIKASKSQSNGRWYNNIDCWKVERLAAQQQQPQPQAYPQQPQGYNQTQPYTPQPPQQPYQQPAAAVPTNNQNYQQSNLPF